jgi:hypothetical protein
MTIENPQNWYSVKNTEKQFSEWAEESVNFGIGLNTKLRRMAILVIALSALTIFFSLGIWYVLFTIYTEDSLSFHVLLKSFENNLVVIFSEDRQKQIGDCFDEYKQWQENQALSEDCDTTLFFVGLFLCNPIVWNGIIGFLGVVGLFLGKCYLEIANQLSFVESEEERKYTLSLHTRFQIITISFIVLYLLILCLLSMISFVIYFTYIPLPYLMSELSAMLNESLGQASRKQIHECFVLCLEERGNRLNMRINFLFACSLLVMCGLVATMSLSLGIYAFFRWRSRWLLQRHRTSNTLKKCNLAP